MRCGVDPEEVGFRPRFVGLDGVWKDFQNGYGALSSPGASGHPLTIGWPISSLGVSGSTSCTANQL